MKLHVGIVVSIFAFALTACGGDSSDGSPPAPPAPPPPPSTYTIGGTVAGLAGSGLVLQNNGGNELTINSSGTFAFSAASASGGSYNVTIRTQPTNPAQNCIASNDIGVVTNANVTNVSIVCSAFLALAASAPTDGEINVARNAAPLLTFSANVSSNTANATNITLTSAAGAKLATFATATTQVTVRPSGNLLPLTEFTLTVTPGVRGAAGEVLQSAVTKRFKTRDGTWRLPTAIGIGSNVNDAQAPEITFDANGNAIAVWFQFDGARFNIWANRYVAGVGWATASLIESNNTGNAYYPQVAADTSGNAMAVWQQFDGSRNSIWANRYEVGIGWRTAELLELDNVDDAGAPQIASDANGNAMAVWYQFDGTRNNIWANRYVVGAGWGVPALIELDDTGDAGFPQVALIADGNAITVWRQFDGTHLSIWANRYVPGTGWGTAVLIESDNTGDADVPRIAIDARGNAIAIWNQSDGVSNNILANRYVPNAGWGVATLVEMSNSLDASHPHIAIDASGNAIAVWQQFNGTRDSIWANRYVPGFGWGTAALIETDDTGFASLPKIAFDASGNAIAVWHQFDGSHDSIWANRYVAGVGWGAAALIEFDYTGEADSPKIAIDGSGNAIAIWRLSGLGGINIWTNRFE